MPPATPSAKPFQAGLENVQEASENLEKKIEELEKRLSEEKEKALLASLKSKEEEAISAKVETSIKDIQDKLRREKKEREMDEARKKAEERVLDIERRLAEEREAWVSTLKNQLNQRDQISQDMEGHFATRLKDLENRWSQEKAAFENEIRNKDAEIKRIQQEEALRSEREKAFWEDRVRVLAVDRDKLERELERGREKFNQEKENFQLERQSLRDNVSRLESSLKLLGEQGRLEKESVRREMEATVRAAEKESRDLQAETDRLEKKIYELTGQIDAARAQNSTLQAQLDKSQSMLMDLGRTTETAKESQLKIARQAEDLKAEISNLEAERTHLQAEKNALENRVSAAEETIKKMEEKNTALAKEASLLRQGNDEDLASLRSQNSRMSAEKIGLERQIESLEKETVRLKAEVAQAKQELGLEEGERGSLARKHDQEIESLKNDFAKREVELEARNKRAVNELETRLRTLQTRLAYYDSNASREYSLARERGRGDLEVLQAKLKAAEEKIQSHEKEREALDRIVSERDGLREQIAQLQDELRETQLEADNRASVTGEKLEDARLKMEKAVEESSALRLELEQIRAEAEVDRNDLARRDAEYRSFIKEVEKERERSEQFKQRIEEIEARFGGKSIHDIAQIVYQAEEQKVKVSELSASLAEYKKQEEVFKEKENSFREMLIERKEAVTGLQGRVEVLERKLSESLEQRDDVRREMEDKLEKVYMDREKMKIEYEKAMQALKEDSQTELSQNLLKQKQKLEDLYNQKMEEAVKMAEQAVEEKMRSEMPEGPDPVTLENQLRSQIETEYLDKMRDQETDFEEQQKKKTEETKKEMDRVKWEAETLREELKKVRESRNQIEREAQELLSKAESHFKRELEKQVSSIKKKSGQSSGLFSKIGQFLDKPIIDTKKKDKDKAA